MDSLISYSISSDLSNLLFTSVICGFTFACMIAITGWVIGWAFNLLSKAF